VSESGAFVYVGVLFGYVRDKMRQYKIIKRSKVFSKLKLSLLLLRAIRLPYVYLRR
jgi:hypothetical protein